MHNATKTMARGRVALLGLILAVQSSVLAGCGWFDPSSCDDFFKSAGVDREAKLRTLPVAQQLDVFICALGNEPPKDYSTIIAEGGQKVISPLMERFRRVSEGEQSDLLLIFVALARRGELRGRNDIVDELERAVKLMKYAPVEAQAERLLHIVQRNVDQPTVQPNPSASPAQDTIRKSRNTIPPKL